MYKGPFVTADLHLGHPNVIKYAKRPFDGVRNMHETIVKRWNSYVPKDQIVYVIGDFAHGPDSLSDAIEVGMRLNGRKILIAGNHDFEKKGKKYQPKDYGDVFDEVLVGPIEVKYNGRRYVLFHYPMESWNGSPHGVCHLHGHCHGMLPSRAQPGQPFRFGRRLDVGMDCWRFYPLPFSEVERIIEDRVGSMLEIGSTYHVAARGGRKREVVELVYGGGNAFYKSHERTDHSTIDVIRQVSRQRVDQVLVTSVDFEESERIV